ncbi:MAG: hypothetical protein KKB65_06280 [Nanoarchaeota archaeon]|nr:hypothetical protein [Nanoarchaeota archaeon]
MPKFIKNLLKTRKPIVKKEKNVFLGAEVGKVTVYNLKKLENSLTKQFYEKLMIPPETEQIIVLHTQNDVKTACYGKKGSWQPDPTEYETKIIQIGERDNTPVFTQKRIPMGPPLHKYTTHPEKNYLGQVRLKEDRTTKISGINIDSLIMGDANK